MPSHATPDYADPGAPPRICQNCSTPLTGPFCAQCGQHDVDYHRGFHHLFHDLAENLFHFEGKFFVTVAWLMAKPGRITREFIAGRRTRQLNPLRFYIFVSVLFFLGLSLLNHGHLIDLSRKAVDDIQLDLTQQAKKVKTTLDDFTPEEQAELARRMNAAAKQHPGGFDGDAIVAAMRAARKPGLLAPANTVAGQSAHTKVRIDPSTGFGQRLLRKLSTHELTLLDIWEAIEHRIPTLLFLGVPLFALLLKIIYIHSGKYYVEHLIFSLHLHTWLFLVLMVGNGYLKLASLVGHWLARDLAWVLILWSLWYVFRSFRVVYGQGRVKTAVKILLLGLVHSFALLMLAVALLSATVAWLAWE